MFKVILSEIYKMKKLKKVYAAYITVNMAPAFMLFIMTIIYVRGMFYGSGAILEFKKELTQSAFLGSYFLIIKYFSWVAWIYVMILTGELVSKEFRDGTIKILLTRPLKRFTLFCGKFFTIVLFYLSMMASYLVLLGLIMLFLKTGFGVRFEQFNFSYVVYGKILFSMMLIDLSFVALVFLVAGISTSVETTIYFNILTILFLTLLDISLTFLIKIQALTDVFSKFLLKYSFMKTTGIMALDKMQHFITGATKEFPVTYDNLFSNFVYCIVFFGFAALVFNKRETLN